MNRGGAAPVTEADPLLLPKWRFEPGKNADEAAFVLRALGLVPDANNAACDGRKHWTWIPPPGPASNGARDGEEALDDDPGPVAFDVASLDEALALEREGPDAERERIWLSPATLVILPPVLISHWLEQIQFALAGDEEEAGFLRRGDAPPRVCVAGAGDAKKGAGGANNAPFMMSLNDDAREDRFDRFDEDSDSDPVGGARRWLFDVEDGDRPERRRETEASRARRSSSGGVHAGGGVPVSFRRRKKSAHDVLASLAGVSPATLASAWDIVLMPANRLSSEFSRADSPLLRVHWRRVVLDEGHQLGGASAITAKLSMACALRAHARWVMTGTPTPATLKGAGVGHLQPLLAFLRQPPFGGNQGLWNRAIQKPLEGPPAPSSGGAQGAATKKGGGGGRGSKKRKKGDEVEDSDRATGASFAGDPTDAGLARALASSRASDAAAEAGARLGALLRRVAVRTLKSDIRLPPLTRAVVPLSFTRAHALAYNELVAFLRRGLLLADWADPSHEESLLNPRRARLATEAVANLREAACVTGNFPVTCFQSEIDETVEDLTEALVKRGENRAVARERAERVRVPLGAHRGECARCRADAFMPMLTPCAHLLCSGCVAVVGDENERDVSDAAAEDFIHERRAPRRCPVCASAYEMQPALPRRDNPTPRQAVPQDLIEIQPSYVQHAWRITDVAEAQGESTKVEYLLERLRAIGAAPSAEDRAREREEEARAIRAEEARTGSAGSAGSAAGEARTLVPSAQQHRWVRPRHKKPPPKCIVYSGFRTHAAVIDLALTDAGVNFENISRVGMTRSMKDDALASFRGDPQVAALVLDRAAAEGLDLSFAERVFVMEPLDNASLEQQVVSRAHRMGQVRGVRVEVLAMRGTAEETLLDVQAELAAAADAEARDARGRRRKKTRRGRTDEADDEAEREAEREAECKAERSDSEDSDSDGERSDGEYEKAEEVSAAELEGRVAAAALRAPRGASAAPPRRTPRRLPRPSLPRSPRRRSRGGACWRA